MIKSLFRDRGAVLNPTRSLKARLGIATGGIVLLLSLLLSGLVGNTTRAQLEATRGQALAELAAQMADKLDRGMFERYREIQILAALPPIRDPSYPQEEKRSLIERVQQTYPDYAWVGLTNDRGIVLASTGGLLEGVDASARLWFQQGRTRPFIGDVHDAKLLAQFLQLPSQEPLRFVDLSAPVVDGQGKFQGVIAAHLSWAWAREVQRSLLEPTGQLQRAEIFILDPKGAVLLGPASWQEKTLTLTSLIVQPNQNHRVETWSDGEFVTGFAESKGYRAYPGLGWRVLVRQNAAIALAPARSVQQQILTIGSLFGVGFAILTWLSAGRIVTPLLKIAAAADQRRRGNTQAEIPVVQGHDELAKLSHSLRYLVASLEAQQAALQESEARFRQMAETIPSVFWLFDLQAYRLLYVSSAYEQIWGRASTDLYADLNQWLDTIHPDDRARMQTAVDRCLSKGSSDEEYRVVRPDGSIRWVRDRGFVVQGEDGQPDRLAGVAEDITDRKQAEYEREQLLHREQAARADAEAANRMKDEFLAVLSHELRSPLNPILGWSRLLQSGKLSPAKTQEALDTIDRNAKLQAKLVDDLLDVSRILRGKLSLNVTSVDLSLVIAAACDIVRLAAEAKAIRIHTEISTKNRTVLGDPSRLQQVIWNLLSNAVKFTPEGGRVEIGLTQVGMQAHLQITDTGKGISADFLPYVFDRFRQEDGSTTRKFGGLGLGLAIVRQLVELHGGAVTVESGGEGQGATFTVQLPIVLDAPQLPTLPQSREPLVDLSGVRILVVDDDPDSREVMRFALAQEHALVRAAASGAEALDAFFQAPPDLLVSDIGMPDMDGYMLIQKIRNLLPEQGGHIPAIAITAYAGEGDQQRAIAAGFQRHVAKPIDPDVVVAIVVELIQQNAIFSSNGKKL